ncbi:response regulator transcription factor [Nocardioides sp. ChNu-153]|uniref:helix-turn-helix transcriptional regulator n=1 Tax=unclassified Nocardioides TaxID=2615069 RepID=UPI002405CC6B|nr:MULTISPECIES: response regulator transcription factor [unclassified Nocardioides]MDF9717466.1 response regulator transcription factor [Nocardioides sp. ChNu-99]MDN7120456.1 response regulator transcription factor [Nocardioides sp. ChNu-153]
MSRGPGPLRLALVNDYEVVVAGLVRLLEPYDAQVRIVEAAAGERVGADADVVLFDTFAQPWGGVRLEDVAEPGTPVVAYTWDDRDEVRAEALTWGAVACVPKSVGAEELVDLLERVRAGAVPGVVPAGTASRPLRARGWPGMEHGLTERESEVLALLAAGRSNTEIAAALHLSINSVKTYLRHAYRKAGVNRRSQAVLWALDHGFGPAVARSRTAGS